MQSEHLRPYGISDVIYRLLVTATAAFMNLTAMCPRIVSIIVNDDQQDAIILTYLFIPNQLYIFRAMSSPIIRSALLYLQHLIMSTGIAAGWCHG